MNPGATHLQDLSGLNPSVGVVEPLTNTTGHPSRGVLVLSGENSKLGPDVQPPSFWTLGTPDSLQRRIHRLGFLWEKKRPPILLLMVTDTHMNLSATWRPKMPHPFAPSRLWALPQALASYDAAAPPDV